VEEDVPPQFEDDPAPEPEAQQLDPVEIPGVIPGVPEVEAPELRRLSRVKFQTKEPYVPSMSGTKYAVAVAQLEDHGALHPDAHMMFYPSMVDNQPDVVSAIMAQLSLKAGMKEWGKEAHKLVSWCILL
jgi:hypothetical protein